VSGEVCIHGVDLDIACNECSPPFIFPALRKDRPGEGMFKVEQLTIEPYKDIDTIFTRPVRETLDVEKGLEISNPEAIKKLDLSNIPRREDPVEICEHCGAEFRGLYHCQSLENIKEIDDSKFLEAVDEAVEVGDSFQYEKRIPTIDGEPVGEDVRIRWSARETVGIGIIDTDRVQRDEDGNTVLLPTSKGEE